MPMRILLAIDYSPESARAVREFAGHPWPPGTVVRVLAPVENAPPSAAELWFDAGGSLEVVMQVRKERAEALAVEAAELLRARGLVVETSVCAGSMRRAVKEEAKEWPADLVIAGHAASKIRTQEASSPSNTKC